LRTIVDSHCLRLPESRRVDRRRQARSKASCAMSSASLGLLA
jgi:hypothetical protein